MTSHPRKNKAGKRIRVPKLFSTSDVNFVEILRHSSKAFLILVGATALQFIFDLLLAQRFGADGYGIFYLCFSVVMVLALIGRLGIDRAVIKFIPAYMTEGRINAARGVSNISVKTSLLFTVPMAILLYISSDTLARSIFNEPSIASYLKIFAFAIPPFALSYIYSGILKSLKKTGPSLFLERISIYFVGILSVLLLSSGWGIGAIITAFTLACYGTALAGALLTSKYLYTVTPAISFSRRKLLLISGPLLFVMFATQMNGQASVLLLGVFGSTVDVGVFNVALKISMLMSIVLAAITTISATKISELYYSNQIKELELVLSKSSALAVILALPLLLLMTLFPNFLLALFGSEFLPGREALVLLGIAQFINATLGASIFALGLTGGERKLALVVGTSLLVNISLGFLLIPLFGVIGAGIATSLTITLSNVILVIVVKRTLGVWLLPFVALRSWARSALALK